MRPASSTRRADSGPALVGAGLVALLALSLLACSERGPLPAAPAVRPSVLLILLDQVSLRLGCYGSAANTPNLDRLAARGRRFDRAYGQYPSLIPSRLALLLGRRPETSRLWHAPESHDAFGDAVPLPEVFRSRGYATARVGRVLGPSDALVAWDETADPAAGDAATTAREAADLLARRRDAPLFLAVGFGAPPPGALPPASFFALYDPRRLRLEPAAIPADLPPMAMADAGVTPAAPTPPLPEEQRRRLLAAELAHVSAVDAQVGVVLEALDRLDLTAKTLVVVVADTAPPGAGPRADLLLEETLHSALIVAGPGVREPGTATDRLVELIDVFPTLADLAGLPKAEGLDGVSLRPLLDDPGPAVKDAAVSAVQRFGSRLGRSVRTDRWRYTEWPDGSRELYDHAADPGELRNLAKGPPAQEAVRRELHERLAASASAATASTAPSSPARAPAAAARGPRPNVLLVIVDDLNVRVGCYGYPVQTPAIDRLAREGRRFDRAYCQIASCSPSRTSLLTGWRPERTGVLDNLQTPRERLTGAVPLQEHFHANGYFTARVGKIYHGPFEEQFHWDLAEHTPYLAGDEAWEPPSKKEREKAGSSARPWTATANRDEDEPDGRTARRVARLLEQHRDRPFFIAAGFNKPHIHWIAPRRYFDLYPPDRIELPREPDDDRDGIPEIAIFRRAPRAPGRFLGGRGERDDAFRREATAAYYACVSFADAQIAVLLEALDRLKLRDRTIVVILGDHGFHLGEHGGLWRKNTLFEEALRVPFVIAAPGVAKPGEASRSVVESLDLYPTLIELAGLPPVPGIEGASLVPILEEPGRTVKPAAFSVAPRNPPELGRSVRTERWRYTEWPDGGRELYDLAPPGAWARLRAALGLGEMGRGDGLPILRNLAGDSRWAPVVAEMQARLDRVGP
jgi:iduronate 2-sulfatase